MEENLELVKKFAASYGTRRPITVFKTLHLSSLRLTISVHSTPFHPIFKAPLIFYYLRLDLPNGPFPSAFPTSMKMLFMLCNW